MNEPDNQSSSIEERPYSLNRGCEGCLAAWVVMFALMLFVSFILADTFGWIGSKGEWRLVYFNWLIGTAVGGYVAARRGKTTGWSNSLLVGIVAQLVIVAQLTDPGDIQSGLRKLLAEPSESWPQLMALVLTIPAAVAGGLVWSRNAK
ncbi:TIGR04086 family membrane protein [Stieleria sp. ICT_E10.1]|uniref:TIGR04086 family membrane protein n=1 Tax=Stieleria sedimenti TaxID=2976331 RepID=UPI00218003B7|nr:TIGR04086 family membrane protein [Stieleria sedimenti]MCS7468870.1 TIGR04086 family membrane protein [Stieleria sedimenti]